MSLIITFKFEVDQKVTTSLGSIGIVVMLGYDDSGNQYYIKTKEESCWFKEKELAIYRES